MPESNPRISTPVVDPFYSQNPGFNVVQFDFHDASAIAGLDFSGLDQQTVLDELMVHQRILRVYPDSTVGATLINNGFDSAHAIVAQSESQFVSEQSANLQGDSELARQIYRNATALTQRAALVWANAKDAVASPHYRQMIGANAGGDIHNFFENLASYQETFGNQNYCDCSECKSILGAAAYLVDLLRIVDKRITSLNSGTIPAGLKLLERRADLGAIPLTCEKTNGLVPYLQIANDSLESYLKADLGLGVGDDVYQTIATASYPFDLSFHRPLFEIRSYLAQVKTDLATVFDLFNAGADNVVRETISLSLEERDRITTSISTGAELAQYYGVTDADLGGLGNVDAFLAQTSLSLDDLKSLLYQELSDDEIQAGLNSEFYINRSITPNTLVISPGATDADPDVIDNLNNGALDNILRFVRLARKLEWSYSNLDWALTTVNGGPGTADFDNILLSDLVGIKKLADEQGLHVEQVCALLYDIKTTGVFDSTHSISLFDTIFNNPDVIGDDEPYHPVYTDEMATPLNSLFATTPTLTWTIGLNSGPDLDQNLINAASLSASLNISMDDLNYLGEWVFGVGTVLDLTVQNLSILYRHSLLAQTMDLSIRESLSIWSLLSESMIQTMTLDNIRSFIKLATWLKNTGVNVYEAEYFLNGTTSKYVDTGYKTANVQGFLDLLWQQQPGSSASAAERQDYLHEHLAAFFGLSADLVAALMSIAAQVQTLPAGAASYTDAFLTSSTAGNPSAFQPYIDAMLMSFSQWLLVQRKLGYTATELVEVAVQPSAFGVSSLNQPTPDDLINLQTFKYFVNAYGDDDNRFLGLITNWSGNDVNEMAAATGWDQATVQELMNQTLNCSGADPVSSLHCFETVMALQNKLNVDIVYISNLANIATYTTSDWQKLTDASDSLLETLRGQYSESQWDSIYKQLQERMLEGRRDALVSLSIWRLGQSYADINTPRKLYEYFLLDPEMSGCTQISYIVQALNSVQLYLQRCRLRLEQGVETIDIPEAWWEWIMNYRVWEANRQIFLYPENYIDPSLRSSKTALFKDLENKLLQSDLSDGAVDDAFKAYFTSFAELAKLKYSNAYRCTVPDPERGDIDTLFLFAHTETDPPIYYYCTQENGVTWTEWRKLELSIPSQQITPIYIFNKLFVFWVEVNKTTNSVIHTTAADGSKSTEKNLYRASIRYSFTDVHGKWVQPQNFVKGDLVYYTSGIAGANDYESLAPFRNIFDMDDPYWHKVYALNVGPQNFKGEPDPATAAEKILLLYGPFMESDALSGVNLATLQQEHDSDRQQFAEHLHERALQVKRTEDTRNSGYLSYNKGRILNADLEDQFLLTPSEFILLERGQAQNSPPPFQPVIDPTLNTLLLRPVENAVHGDYVGDFTAISGGITAPSSLANSDFEVEGISSAAANDIHVALNTYGVLDANNFVASFFSSQVDLNLVLANVISQYSLSAVQIEAVQSTLFTAMGDAILCSSLAGTTAKTMMIKNQPGDFILDNGDETFLLQPNTKHFDMISTSMTVSAPTIDEHSFIVDGITSSASNNIFSVLRTYGIVDENGIADQEILDSILDPVTGIGLDAVLANEIANGDLTSGQVSIISAILLNYAIAYSNSFVATDIDEAASSAIFQTLKTYGVIDTTGRIDKDLLSIVPLSTILANELSAGVITEEQLPFIRTTLYALAAPTALNYWNSNDDTNAVNIHDFHFTTTRLSTRAVHPLSRDLFTGGVDRLLQLRSQQIPVTPLMPFDRLKAGSKLLPPSALDGEQVSFDGPFGNYFWEVFFHVPFLVASRLAADQQFEQAERWLKYIFDPTLAEQNIRQDTFYLETQQAFSLADSGTITSELQSNTVDGGGGDNYIVDADGRVNTEFGTDTDLSFLLGGTITEERQLMVRNILFNYQIATLGSRFWQFQPFRNHHLQTLREMLSDTNPALAVYSSDPFDPHAIAQLRIGAYEKTIVMKYIDILINWGDYYFAQDSWESITQAAMLYIYAYDLLGPRPVDLGVCEEAPPTDFYTIKAAYSGGDIPQFLIDAEHLLPSGSSTVHGSALAGTAFNDLDLQFCVPANDQFVGYWNKVEDRLFKIRHCMNLEGDVRQLALFQPRIDPNTLVRAAAAGNNIADLLNHGLGSLPHYRFNVILARARGLTEALSALGSAILAALEKKDAEQLALLRSTQENNLLKLQTVIRNKSIEESQNNLLALQESLKGAKARQKYYTDLINKKLSAAEQETLDSLRIGLGFNIAAQVMNTAASIAYAVPQAGSPFAMTYGGVQLGSVVQAAGGALEIGAAIENYRSQTSGIVGGHQRRAEEWGNAKDQAASEISQIEKRIAAAQSAIDSSKQELTVHQTSIKQAGDVDAFLRSKFSNEDLYQWMLDRLATVYFQTYKMALDLARKAERTYQFELGSEESFVTINYWDSTHKGLLAGESLMFALNQMEKAYLDNNTRALEIEKTVSLLQIAPEQLLTLKATGKCTFSLDERLFDYDYPGHYRRQIKTLSVSVPALVGPFQNIKASLTQCSDYTVIDPQLAAVQSLLSDPPNPDASVRVSWRQNQQIAISRGVDDAGVFHLDFNDERYLPFEGSGAVSNWKLEIPKSTNRIDFDSIADVLLHVKYTALPGDWTFRNAVENELKNSNPYPGAAYLNLKQAFASEWHSLMTMTGDSQTISFPISSKVFLPNLNAVQLNSIALKLDADEDISNPAAPVFMTLSIAGNTAENISLSNNYGTLSSSLAQAAALGDWVIEVDVATMRTNPDLSQLLSNDQLDPAKFKNLELILFYQGDVDFDDTEFSC